jgi:O-acetyl-ADP-ribose deacetylase (regulator of RNase III)
MKSIKYVKGDATRPVGEGQKIIIHCCNDIGGWGSGFVLALSARWRQPEDKYRMWCRGFTPQDGPFALGGVQFVRVSPDITVANIIGQHDIRPQGDVPPIRYEAIDEGLAKVAEHALSIGASVHGPRLGSDRAGGEWDKIARLLIDRLCSRDIDVTVYDLPRR